METEKLVCKSCGAPIVTGQQFCSRCGIKIENTESRNHFCQSCGSPVVTGQQFCSRCGSKVASARAQNSGHKSFGAKCTKPIYKQWWAWISVVSVVIVSIMLSIAFFSPQNTRVNGGAWLSRVEKNAIGAAESYVASAFFIDTGTAPDRLKSEVIYSGKDYNGDDVHLIAVWCYWGDSPAASYCVSTKIGTFRDSTDLLPSGFDFYGYLPELKALFGITN